MRFVDIIEKNDGKKSLQRKRSVGGFYAMWPVRFRIIR